MKQKPIIITNENPDEVDVKTTYDHKSGVIRIKIKSNEKNIHKPK